MKVCILLAIVVLSQDGWGELAAANDPEALTLLRQTAEAHGGLANIAKIRDARFSGVAVTKRGDTMQRYPFITRTRGFNQTRTEVNAPGFVQTTINNGEHGWVVSSGSKEPRFTNQTANRLVEVNPVLGLLSAFAASKLELAYDGFVEDAGGSFHIVSAYLWDTHAARLSSQRPLDSRFELAIDGDTYLIRSLGFSRVGTSAAGQIVEEYVYTDYRIADGLQVPFRVEHWRGGRLIKEIQVEDFFLTQHGAIFLEP